MLMVIFGAGASYDSFHSQPPFEFDRNRAPNRPPLADELFLDSGVFADSLRRFPACHPIVPYLQRVPEGQTIESVLEGLQSEAETDQERFRQIAAIRFYLQFVIWECERHWSSVVHGITNYLTLLDQLRRSCADTVCLVTFNYDRMIENALPSVGVRINDLPDYIASDAFKLFKLHGSINWGREVSTPVSNVDGRTEWDIGRELIQRADQLDVSSRFRIVEQIPIGKLGDVPLFPAIAIPVETKNEFECPEAHLECLKSLLPQITKILIIGWRGTEQHFLNLLADSLTLGIPTCVVAGNVEEERAVLERIRLGGISVGGTESDGGFTDFITRRGAEKFLQI